MVAIFSIFSVSRSGHRRTQSGIDGIIWKERVSASMRRRGELAIAQDGVDVESDGSVTKPSPTSQCNPNRRFSPSLSAPQPHMLNLLDECKASGTI
ncbi:unnamed protein product [Brassica oleracea]